MNAKKQHKLIITMSTTDVPWLYCNQWQPQKMPGKEKFYTKNELTYTTPICLRFVWM